jgi:hypothetical protein
MINVLLVRVVKVYNYYEGQETLASFSCSASALDHRATGGAQWLMRT